jgi:hypothetical protein
MLLLLIMAAPFCRYSSFSLWFEARSWQHCLDSGDNKFVLLYNFVVALHCDFDLSNVGE